MYITINNKSNIKRVSFKSETEAFDVNTSKPPAGGYRDLRAKEGYGKRPGLDNSTIPQEQTTSKRTRSITGIQDLADRPHADK